MLRRYFKIALIPCALGVILGGCSYFSTPPKPYPGLENRGPLALSPSNPYLGANLFLAREMRKSSYLYEFLKHKGAPHAIRINENLFKPTEIKLYYPKHNLTYSAEPEAKEDSKQWIVRGPYPISHPDRKELRHLMLDLKKEPVFDLSGHKINFKKPLQRKFVKTPVLAKVPKPKIKKRPKRKAKPKKPKIDKAKELAKKFKPLNSDQQAIAMSKGFAERAHNGDLVHTVKSEHESIDAIAKWYTGDIKNKDKILAASKVENADKLRAGERITVPIEYIKNLKAMSSDFYLK